MDDLNKLRDEYLQLRANSDGAMLATLDEDRLPCASYAPLVWLDGCAYLFLSDLAEHTRNLKRQPVLSLVLVAAGSGANAFARQRISLQGSACLVERDDACFAPVMAEFERRFGQVMQVLESLPDFHLFALDLCSGRYIRGFGQAYELDGEGLAQLRHVDPRR